MSENLNKLYTIIQINGELNNSKPSDLKLLERELYVDNAGNLLYGDTNGNPKQINADKANKATWADNLGSEESLAFITNSGIRLGSINIGSKYINGQYDNTRKVDMLNFNIQDSIFNEGQITNLNTLTIKEDMWGTELPTDNLQHGRVFFLVSEQ